MTESHDKGGAHTHSKHLAHHFDTPQQQYESGKTGMWLFLSTEILLFSGLFCAYAVYRSHHPEIFVYAHRYLDKTLGGINTLVLILSSFTAAWAVRAAQLNQKKLLIGLVVTTLLCAATFMGIKAVEYNHKWKHGLLWGQRYAPAIHEEGHGAAGESGAGTAGRQGEAHSPSEEGRGEVGGAASAQGHGETGAGAGRSATGGDAGAASGTGADQGGLDVHSNIPPAAEGPAGLASDGPEAGMPHAPAEAPRNVQVFFGIYFVMTGLHAIHVLAGMAAFGWILFRAIRGEFGSDYFAPVDMTALYWHLVDLIWIYLFPLLYLIH